MPDTPTNALLTVKEAADFLRLSVRTINYMRERGEIRHVRLGSRVFFRRDDLNNLIDANTHVSMEKER